ncbi:acylphosphatase [Dokdonella fugitiva]|uniref:Acylphosphatase n=1 Tax=Dokdonella fugitiva TaxID=328517 RepID=A0A839F442_9GAMM|nr:acylphosphatase [Dokdonella fugitiva]MBA8889356.1 acylphosphatase [Dokdonella fugitiva]
MSGARFHVSGLVQGVFFRASTQARARELGLVGWAKNLVDGRVEVVAGGDAAAIDELERWLLRGPPGARVDAVEREPFDAPPRDGFARI